MTTSSQHTDICIIGAGISGLTVATQLQKKGINCCIVESQPTPGGRIQTDKIKGFLCDRGFQVLLPAYPSAKTVLDYTKLHLHAYPKGASVFSPQQQWFGAPFLYPSQWKKGQKLPLPINDILQFAKDITSSPFPKPSPHAPSTQEHIHQHYSKTLANNFLIPFFQGVLLDPKCKAPANLFKYYLRLFALGGTAIPKQGMGALSTQLADTLLEGTLKTNHTVESIDKNTLYCTNGVKIHAKKIVLAVDQRAAASFISTLPPAQKKPVTTFFFSTKEIGSLSPLNFIRDKQEWLNISIPSLICPNYAPKDQHLCMVTTLSNQTISEDNLLKKLSESYIQAGSDWSLIHKHHIEYALPTPGYNQDIRSPYYVCGDWIQFGSIETAIQSGLHTAKKLIKALN